MKPYSTSKISLPLLLKVALVLQLQLVVASASRATTNNPSSSSSSVTTYQPTPGVEERWVAEEEFHGASSSLSSTKSKRRLEKIETKKRGKKYHIVEEHSHSWWDDDDDDENNGIDGERLMLPSTSPVKEGKNTLKAKGGRRLRIWRNSKDENKKENSPPHESFSESLTQGSATVVDDQDDSHSPLLTSEYDEEHPMRTDEWKLDINLSRFFPKEEGDLFLECYNNNMDRRTRTSQTTKHEKGSNNSYRKRQVMQFARNGYVKILDDNKSHSSHSSSRHHPTITGAGKRKNKPMVGKWRIGHSGIAFDVPVQVNVRRKKKGGGGSDDDNNDNDKDNKMLSRMTVLHYHADIHLNKFGERPRMFRGVITRDRHGSFLPPNFLRPVIGTFSAEGIGHDTADTSYKERAISLSRQQMIDDARR